MSQQCYCVFHVQATVLAHFIAMFALYSFANQRRYDEMMLDGRTDGGWVDIAQAINAQGYLKAFHKYFVDYPVDFCNRQPT